MAASSTAATATANAAARREAESSVSSNAPTAKFLQARIDTLRNTLVSRLENILAAAIDNDGGGGGGGAGNDDDNTPAPPLTDTAAKQLQIDVESTALIRAAEEIMLLTRTMKELWLFGGLDTIASYTAPADGENQEEEAAAAENENKIIKQDEKQVVQGLLEFLARLDAVNGNGSGSKADAQKEGDIKMKDETT